MTSREERIREIFREIKKRQGFVSKGKLGDHRNLEPIVEVLAERILDLEERLGSKAER